MDASTHTQDWEQATRSAQFTIKRSQYLLDRLKRSELSGSAKEYEELLASSRDLNTRSQRRARDASGLSQATACLRQRCSEIETSHQKSTDPAFEDMLDPSDLARLNQDPTTYLSEHPTVQFLNGFMERTWLDQYAAATARDWQQELERARDRFIQERVNHTQSCGDALMLLSETLRECSVFNGWAARLRPGATSSPMTLQGTTNQEANPSVDETD